tara:strand:- start:1347 stop:1520 length:174 start_codon:yes stop_codon:yes gene_type:complete
MFKEFWYFIGDFFTKSFEILPIIGNKFNYLYILIISAFLVLWTVQMFKHQKEKKSIN